MIKTDPSAPYYPCTDAANCSGITIREHIVIQTHCALATAIITRYGRQELNAVEIAELAIIHTDAIINAINDNP